MNKGKIGMIGQEIYMTCKNEDGCHTVNSGMYRCGGSVYDLYNNNKEIILVIVVRENAIMLEINIDMVCIAKRLKQVNGEYCFERIGEFNLTCSADPMKVVVNSLYELGKTGIELKDSVGMVIYSDSITVTEVIGYRTSEFDIRVLWVDTNMVVYDKEFNVVGIKYIIDESILDEWFNNINLFDAVNRLDDNGVIILYGYNKQRVYDTSNGKVLYETDNQLGKTEFMGKDVVLEGIEVDREIRVYDTSMKELGSLLCKMEYGEGVEDILKIEENQGFYKVITEYSELEATFKGVDSK